METSQTLNPGDAGEDAAPLSRRDRNAQDKREAIFAGARAVFMEHGFGGASMDAVAEAAGVSKMTLYRYFDSKETLFAGLIEAMCARILENDPATLPDAAPPADALRHFARRFLRTVYDPETVALLRVVVGEVTRFPELGRLFYRSGPARNIDGLAAYFAAHAGDPALAVTDPRKAAEEFFELVRGYTHLRLLLGVQETPDDGAVEAQIGAAIARFMQPG